MLHTIRPPAVGVSSHPREECAPRPHLASTVAIRVLRGTGEPLQQWRQEQRDVHADFLKLFGDESTAVPPLRSVAVSGDSDNTHRHTLALLSELVLR